MIHFFLSCFTSTQIFNNSDLYLCDLFLGPACRSPGPRSFGTRWASSSTLFVRRAGLQDLDLLVHVGRVHPLCSSGLFVRLIEASKQSLKRAKKRRQARF